MAETLNETFDEALARYQAGESAEALLPVFKEICATAPKLSSAWTCLAWLQLLVGEPANAIKSAEKAIKLDTYDVQARVNLAMALIEAKQKGVRGHVEIAQQIVQGSPEAKEQLESSFADGLQRKPDWASLKKVHGWIFEEAAA
jgi:predicted Zn-dependent protease